VSELSGKLTRAISSIKGVGDVEVQIYIEEGTSYEYEYNISENNKITNERDQNDGNREIEEDDNERELVVIQDSAGNEKPVIRREKKPEISGVLIVAEGAGVSSRKREIFQAVQGLLDLPAHRINVLPQ
ncbi:MAG: stage III sporulation protein AG, partial [Halanaerobiales bacterium]